MCAYLDGICACFLREFSELYTFFESGRFLMSVLSDIEKYYYRKIISHAFFNLTHDSIKETGPVFNCGTTVFILSLIKNAGIKCVNQMACRGV